MNTEGKIIDFMGDSITEGVGVSDIENCRYDNRVKKMLNLKETYNYGVSGTRIAHQSKPSDKPRHDLCFCGRAYDLNKNADVIVVYGGINDYLHGDARFGSMEDTTPLTFCGGVEFLMNTLNEVYPNAKKVFMTPAKCKYKEEYYLNKSSRSMKADDAKPVRDYGNVIMKKAEKYGYAVVDLYEKIPVDFDNDKDIEKYTADGLHFNDAGHKFIAEALAEVLKAL